MSQPHTFLSCVLRRLGEALDWIQKTHWSPNLGVMHLLSLEDGSSVSGLKHASICFFVFSFVFLPGLAWVIRLLSEDHWTVYGFSSLIKFPLLYFLSISSKCYCRGSKFYCWVCKFKLRNIIGSYNNSAVTFSVSLSLSLYIYIYISFRFFLGVGLHKNTFKS